MKNYNPRAAQSILTNAPAAFANGVPVIVYGASMISAGGDAIRLYDGDPAETDIMIRHEFTADSATLDLPFGVVFPNGCWTDTVGQTSITLFYTKL